MLDKEFKYYLSHKEDLLKEYPGKFIVVKDESVVGAFDSEIDAYTFGTGKFELGTFLIQQCLPNDENYIQTFHSRVIFA